MNQVKRKKFEYNSASSSDTVSVTSSEEIADNEDPIENVKEEKEVGCD